MPFPRPVSPITFESCSPPASDINPDDLLGSDDELDDTARAAKRQRIEKLAESYLRGQPLFILSASLRGPFEKGWKNPWSKKRKTAAGSKSRKVAKPDGHAREAGPVVQETDPRHPKYREDLSAACPPVDASLAETSTVVPSKDARPLSVVGSAQKRPRQHAAVDQENRASPRSAKKPKDASSMSTSAGDASFARNGTANWLKKDRKRMNFGRFEPPSSPTPKIASRQAESKLRMNVPRSVEGRALEFSALQTPKTSTAPGKHSAVHASSRPTQTSVPVTYQPSTVANRSPRKEQMSPKKVGYAATSFNVVSSTSQLPRFEYRCLDQDSSQQAKSKSHGKRPPEPPPPAEALYGQYEDIPLPDAPEPTKEPLADHSAEETGQSFHRSKDLRFADAEGSESTEAYPQVPTEHNTYENLPSAQQVPPPPGVSDRMPSLHSTAMPRTDTDHSRDTSPDTQLSTQAALLHAQKSFQDDLESPEQRHGKTPAQPRPQSPSGDDSVLLAQETPFYLPNAGDKSLLRSSRRLVRDRMQNMSTQCMIDAATPFTFSTEKKTQAYRPISPQKTSPREPEIAHKEAGSLEPSPSPENVYETAQSSPGNSNPPEDGRLPEQTPAHPSTTQGTALPFDLSGDTPTTAQDGQGGLQDGESFPLSQAIADLGSWLGQSFGFLKEIRPPSQSRRGRSSQNTHSALDLDMSR